MSRGCDDCKRYHRRAQKAEAEVAKLTAQLAAQHTTVGQPGADHRGA